MDRPVWAFDEIPSTQVRMSREERVGRSTEAARLDRSFYGI
jgi:hypothetical protein